MNEKSTMKLSVLMGMLAVSAAMGQTSSVREPFAMQQRFYRSSIAPYESQAIRGTAAYGSSQYSSGASREPLFQDLDMEPRREVSRIYEIEVSGQTVIVSPGSELPRTRVSPSDLHGRTTVVPRETSTHTYIISDPSNKNTVIVVPRETSRSTYIVSEPPRQQTTHSNTRSIGIRSIEIIKRAK